MHYFFYIVQISLFYFKKQSSKREFRIQFGLIIHIFELGTYSILPQFGKYPIFIFKNPSTLHIVDCMQNNRYRTHLAEIEPLWALGRNIGCKNCPWSQKGGLKSPINIFIGTNRVFKTYFYLSLPVAKLRDRDRESLVTIAAVCRNRILYKYCIYIWNNRQGKVVNNLIRIRGKVCNLHVYKILRIIVCNCSKCSQ